MQRQKPQCNYMYLAEQLDRRPFTITLCTDSAACTRPCNIHTQVSHFAFLVALLLEKVAREWLPLKKCFGQLFLLLRPSHGPISKTEKTSKMRAPSDCPLKNRLSLAYASPEISGLYTHRHTHRHTIKVLWTPVGYTPPSGIIYVISYVVQ